MKTTSSRSKIIYLDRTPRAIPYYLGHFFVYLGCVIVAVVIGWGVLKTYRLYANYQAATGYIALIQAKISDPDPGEPSELQDNISRLATSLDTLYQEATPLFSVTPYFGWVPIYGGDIEATPQLLAAGRDLSEAGAILSKHFPTLLRLKSQGEQARTLPQMLALLTQAQGDLSQVDRLLRRAQIYLAQVDTQRLSPGTGRQITLLQQYLPLSVTTLGVTQQLPELLGADAPRTYLILTQNSDELRPSGGYINTAGHVIFYRGQIIDFVMQDSYAVDQISEEYPYPPYPLYQYMAADYWVLRDASWSPDFPTAAQNAIDLYELGLGVRADGVIALDQYALPYLLQAIEPLEVADEQVTSKNVITLMRRHWAPEQGQEQDREWWFQRKSFMLDLAEIMRQKFERELNTTHLSTLSSTLQQALAEKHILIYLEDPNWARFLADKNWAGSLVSVQGDYLMVADANLGFNKASALVQRHLDYQVTLAEDGSVQAQTRLIYYHPSPRQIEVCRQEIRYEPIYEQNMEGCYWNYLQLITPAGAELISGPNIVVEGKHLLRGQATSGEIEVTALTPDKVSWGQLFLLAPGQSQTLDYSYRLPPETAHFSQNHWEYTLYLQKQAGTLGLETEVGVTLPDGAQLLESQPQPLQQTGSVLNYEVDLKTDQTIKIQYSLR